MVSGGGCTHLATHTPSPSSLSPPHSLPNPLSSPIPSLRPMSGSGNGPKASRLVLIEWEGKHVDLSRLAEFQTPTVFDHDFDLDRSIF
jgi:hypothetical protein